MAVLGGTSASSSNCFPISRSRTGCQKSPVTRGLVSLTNRPRPLQNRACTCEYHSPKLPLFPQSGLGDQMKALLALLLLTVTAAAQNFVAPSSPLPDAPSQHRFWTLETKINTGILAGLVATDAFTTQRGLDQGYREANPIMRPFVTRGIGGQAAGSALGFGAGLGTVYLLHKTHHHKAERIAMRLMVGVEGAVVANNFFATR